MFQTPLFIAFQHSDDVPPVPFSCTTTMSNRPETLGLLLARSFILIGIIAPVYASLYIQLEHPSMTTTTSFLITLGLTVAVLGMILFSITTGLCSSQVIHSFTLMGTWARPICDILGFEFNLDKSSSSELRSGSPLESKLNSTPAGLEPSLTSSLAAEREEFFNIFQVVMLLTGLLFVAGLVINLMHRRWGPRDRYIRWKALSTPDLLLSIPIPDVQNDWSDFLQIAALSVRFWLCIFIPVDVDSELDGKTGLLKENQLEFMYIPVEMALGSVSNYS
ncbi:hypothetical protein C8J56DRAFT_499472 [Mycena floridula]|nr:hypothetical protein C8J56DRAFT_499472 [Mycena floridula]